MTEKKKIVIGRPRSKAPEDDELEALGRDLVEWASEETDELRCRYAQWYSVKQGISHAHWKAMIKHEIFRLYYEQAQTILSKNYIDGTIRDSIAHRFLRIYTPEVKEEENELLEFQHKLKLQEANAYQEADLIRHNEMMNQISSLQESSKSARINSNNE